jgi:hypothetical protein
LDQAKDIGILNQKAVHPAQQWRLISNTTRQILPQYQEVIRTPFFLNQFYLVGVVTVSGIVLIYHPTENEMI